MIGGLRGGLRADHVAGCHALDMRLWREGEVTRWEVTRGPKNMVEQRRFARMTDLWPATNGETHAEEQTDLVTSMADEHVELKANGGTESTVSHPDAHVEAAAGAPIHLPPPTEADSPL